MKQFTSVNDVADVDALISEAITLKKDPFANSALGKNKMLGCIFLNSSLRTRLSTQKAAMNLGMQVIVMNINQEGWQLEFAEGAVMNGNKPEHIKDAAAVIGNYCDIVAVRAFPSLTNREEDYREFVLEQFIKYCNKPFISLESATLHPLQSLADAITIKEHLSPAGGGRGWKKPKVVLTWAPHIKPLPQAVANSFSEWMLRSQVDFHIAQPEGYELADQFTKGATLHHSQQQAIKDADFIYVKNWSSYNDYGKMPEVKGDWLLNHSKTKDAYIMHCLPVRRNVELVDELLDSDRSLVTKQAENRVYAAQSVIKRLLQ